MNRPQVALLSPGAMGSAIAARLAEQGVSVITSLVGRSEASRARAAVAGMESVPDSDLVTADIILSVVPPGEAEALAQRLLPLLADVDRKPLYIDANALNPASKLNLDRIFREAGCRLVDGSIVGPPPAAGTALTTIYLSGSGAPDAAWLGRHGLDVRILDGPIGAASALKMCFAGINKGMIGLAAIMLLAAERAGAGDALATQLAMSMPDLVGRFQRQIPDMYPKAWRWAAEMREIGAFLEAEPAGRLIFEGMAQLYERLSADAIGDQADRVLLDTALARAS